MSKQVPQPVYGLKGGTKDFEAHEEGRDKKEHHKGDEEHKKRAKEHHEKFCER